eukprot:UN2610
MCARFNQRLINNLRQQDNNVVHKLFYVGAQEEPTSPLWCHDGPKFRRTYHQRAVMLGDRLSTLEISDDCIVQRSSTGVYRVDGEGSAATIKHINGIAAPSLEHTVLDSSWTFQDNWTQKGARLTRGSTSSQVYEHFKAAGLADQLNDNMIAENFEKGQEEVPSHALLQDAHAREPPPPPRKDGSKPDSEAQLEVVSQSPLSQADCSAGTV